MPEEEIGNHPSMTKARVRLIYFGMFMTFVTTLAYPTVKQLYPELLETDYQHEMIKEEALQVALDFPSEVMKKYKVDSAALYDENKKMKGQVFLLRKEMLILEREIEGLSSILEGVQKQNNFNTYQIGINCGALFNGMNKDEKCPEVPYRYIKKRANKYVLFNDWYECKTLQPIQLEEDCGVYVSPFDRNRIKLY